MTISQRIFEELKKQKKQQKDLATYIGISTSAVSDWKKKGTNPSAEYISAIADFLDVSTDFLLTGTEHSKNANILNSTVGAVGNYSNGTVTLGSTTESKNKKDNTSKYVLSENEEELLRIFKSLPKRERVRLLNMVYEFEEDYRRKEK